MTETARLGEEATPLIRVRRHDEAGDDRIRMPDVDVRPGELVVLEGTPGSGKSTLLRSAMGFADQGAYRLEVDGLCLGLVPHRQRRRVLARLRLLYVPREPALVSNLTVMDNLLLPNRFLGEGRSAETAQAARDHLESMGLAWAALRPPARLSRSDRKAVALLRGLLREPRAALLNDPLDGVARQRSQVLRPLLRAAAERGCALLVVSRPGGPYRSLATRIISMEGGEADGPGTQL